MNPSWRKPGYWCEIVIAAAIVSLILCVCLMALTPPTDRDALTHHLAAPKLYLQKGGIVELPSFPFSYYPMNLDFLYMIPLYFGNDIAPKFIHFSFGILTALLIGIYLRKRSGATYGLLGALFFLSIPVVVKLSISAYVDLGLIFFSAASLLFFLRWIEKEFVVSQLVVSGVFCGLALGTKYNALVVFFLLAVFIPFCFSRFYNESDARNGEKPGIKIVGTRRLYLGARYCAIFVFVSVLLYSPWGIRNVVWTDNPIYPLYQGFFKKVPVEQDEEQEGRRAGKTGSLAMRKILYGEQWYETALVPLRIFFQGKDDNPRYFDGRLNPFLIIWPIFAFFWLKRDPAGRRRDKLILASFSVLFLLFAFFSTKMRIRYIGPIIPPLVILSVMGIEDLSRVARESDSYGKIVGILAVASVLVAFSMNASYLVELFRKVDSISYISGRVDRQEYLRKHVPEFSAVQYVNASLAPEDKVLALYLGNRRYYFEREVVFGTGIMQRSVPRNGGPEKIVDALKSQGITHLVVGTELFERLAPLIFDEQRLPVVMAFFKSKVRLLFFENGYAVYELKKGLDPEIVGQ